MINVHDYAHNLARALKECPEHKAYLAARAKVRARPTAEQMVADFHKRQMELQALSMEGKEPTEQQREALQQFYAVLQTDADVREYLHAEQRLSVLLSDIYRILGDALELDLPATG